ncbi:progesterone-induced-blocking factor, putative [Entamoeba invadens IP1]|uniref:Progesterone-induced-blocking factor, putative n=1 Tax=Entamoeba invadens IP1 TaxID=370355 RepID=A0A0A1U277_ENTIV|nr:progesterone-induced-blocking factor, putative [Entamoeba invadens IP1]ELP88176.1 progesterone-induced-blocking factor, putative [Entamoeba invadens IP1]|eukprot:XP_004254947.1 progesterone-induced-blocking factor, putative [Entamoeba invadens IP1]
MVKINILVVLLFGVLCLGKNAVIALDPETSKHVEKVVEKEMQKAYADSFRTTPKVFGNRTQEELIHKQLQRNRTKVTKKAVLNITAEILKVETKIAELNQKQSELNRTIEFSKTRSSVEKSGITATLKTKIEEYNNNTKLMNELSEKKSKLNDLRVEYVRTLEEAKTNIETMAEEMRTRRRLVNDLERKNRRKQETQKAVEEVRKVEYKKLVTRIKELENTKDEIRRLQTGEEMKLLALRKREAKIREINRRKRLILAEQLKAAKITRNAEMITMIYKQLAELKTHKLSQISCARKAFEDYKEKKRIELLKKKEKIIDKKLLAELVEKKGKYLLDTRRVVQEEIDKLRLEKELFDHERVVEGKKLAALMKIQKKEIEEAKRRVAFKKVMYSKKREELLRQQMRTMWKKEDQYENEMKRKILSQAVKSSKKMITKQQMLNDKLKILDNSVQLKKKILKLQSQDANLQTVKERIEIQKLKDEFYKLSALKEKQKMQLKASQEFLKHNTHLDDLDEVEQKANIAMVTNILKRKGVQKSVIKESKLNAKEALKDFKDKLQKEYMLKKKVLYLKRCLRARIAVNDEIKKKQIENKLKEMIRKAVVARIQTASST